MKHSLNPQIINAVVWAVVMLVTAFKLRGTDVGDDTQMFLLFVYIAGWITTTGLLHQRGKTE